jgi:hypothetical protein
MLLVLLPVFFMVGAVVGLFLFRRGGFRNVDGGTDPLCGQCGYCVRGLETMICPECGGDLREVGIITPGSARPMSRGKRLLLWTLAAPLPALLIYGLLYPLLGPQWMRTTQRRVIFSQSSYCFVTITANAHGKKLVFGNPSAKWAPVPPEVLFLSHNKVNSSMDVRLPVKTFRYLNAAGKPVSGNFDAKAIETWLNDAGFTDPRVAERANDIAASVAEMGTPAGAGFTHFPNDRWAPGVPTGGAHPTFTVTQTQPNELTAIAGIVVLIFVWLAGLPFVLRWRTRRRVPPAAPTLTASAAPVN